MVVRVVAVRPDGVELIYELPSDTPIAERASSWYFPLRVLKPANAPAKLLDRADVERRVDAWLKTAQLPRAACGQWIFTWNAFRISCDPEDALKAASAFDIGSPDLHDGALYSEEDAVGTAPLMRRVVGDGATFSAELVLDAEQVRRQRVESDVVVAKLTGKAITLQAAQETRAKDLISGTISISFDVDRTGEVRRRTKVIRMETKRPAGVEKETVTEILEQHAQSDPA